MGNWAIMYNFVDSASNICDDEYLVDELNHFENTFENCGYNKQVIKRAIRLPSRKEVVEKDSTNNGTTFHSYQKCHGPYRKIIRKT